MDGHIWNISEPDGRPLMGMHNSVCLLCCVCRKRGACVVGCLQVGRAREY